MSFITKFNTLKKFFQKPAENWVPGEKISDVKSFDDYITLTRQAVVEQVGGTFSLYFSIEILLLLDRYAKFFAGEFTEDKNKEFKKISELFLKGLWSHEAIYVAYGQKFVDLELALSKKYPGVNVWKVMTDCKWRIYTVKKDHDNLKYTSLITGIPDIIIDEEDLLEVKWDNSYTWRFLSWWKIAVNMTEFEQMYFDLCKIAMKKVNTDAADDKQREKANNVLLDANVFLNKIGSESLIQFKGIEFQKIPELVQYFDAITQWFYFNVGQLGYTGNSSEKTERMTTGEHVKDLKPIVNNQKITLTNLQYFAEKAKEKWGEELNFIITSNLSMDGSNIQINNADTPQGPVKTQKFNE